MNDKSSSDQGRSNPGTENADGEANKTETQPNESAPAPVADPVDSSAQQPNAAEGKGETDRKQDESIALLAKQTQWIKYQTVAATFLGAITLIVLIYHGVVMRGQLEYLRFGERPYITVTRVDMNMTSGEPVEMVYTVQNKGKTPALKLGIEPTFHWDSTPPEEPFSFAPLEAEYAYEVFLPSDKEEKVTVTSKDKITDKAFEEIMSGAIKFYSYGRGWYHDGLGKRYYFEFCYYYLPGKSSMTQCPRHNYTN